MADQTDATLAVAKSTENTPNPEPTAAEVPLEPQNEPDPTAVAPSKTGMREKIRKVTGDLFSGFRKGKGRPKKCRECGGVGCPVCHWTGIVPGKADVVPVIAPSEDVPSSQGEADLVGSAVADPGRASLFRRSVVAAARSVIKILTGIVKVYCDAAELDSRFTEKAIARCQPETEALDRWTESFDVVLKKHQCEPKYAEEIALAVNTVELMAPFGVLLAELKGEIRRRREAGK